jgi:hypothetical protein
MNDARARLARLAWLLDSSIPLPGTPFSIGLEALIGLVPVAGDLAGVLLSGYIIKEAAALGASRSILARMALNVAVEGLAGMIPFAGDIFDAAFKANQRNVRLLDAYLDQPARTRRASRGFLLVLGLALLGLVLAILVLGTLLVRWIWRSL